MANSKSTVAETFDDLPDATWRRSMRRSVLTWYSRHARDLPWRNSSDPYRVWVSEIMLQQTQVETVVPYFQRFVSRFPNARELASANEDDVLRLWEGLGYYRRARQLHQAARQIVEHHNGEFPNEIQQVRDLPGIGRYTAGAILSIAMDQRQPILEGNTIRLYSRLLGYHGDPRGTQGQRLLWRFAEAILPRRSVGDFNQAMMELGSTVCRPRSPSCDECPLARLCPTRASGWQDQIPAASKKIAYEDLAETVVIVRRRQHVLLRRCGPDERWAGLWDFPRFAHDPNSSANGQLVRQVNALTGIRILPGTRLTSMKHGVTRYRITLTCYAATYDSGQVRDPENCRWVEPKELADYPLSVTGRKLSRWVEA